MSLPTSGLTTYDAKAPDTSYPPITDVQAPDGAPNVLVILIDDVGFGTSSAFGGPCETPNFEKLAAGGLRYNRFHGAALADAAGAADRPQSPFGQYGQDHRDCYRRTGLHLGPAEYEGTAAVDVEAEWLFDRAIRKCHEVPVWQTSPAGPFTAWPTGGGVFEYFYAFIGGENNQWDPAL